MRTTLPPEVIILREFLAGDDRYVSGNRLAERLDISRVAVWSHMEKLRSAGFVFEARPRLGYRLEAIPSGLSALYLQASLPDAWSHVPIHFHETIDSTNREAERLLASGASAPFVVLARQQTEGRGRLGRSWFSGDSGNLYLSFVFQPRLPPRRMQTFTLWMGAILCDFLNGLRNAPVRVKWPNDLLLHGGKIGGMLTEARIDHDRIRDLVFGLGLNVNGDTASYPPELVRTATSLAAETGEKLELNSFAADLLQAILDAYRDFTEGVPERRFRQLWSRYDTLVGRTITVRQGNETLSGIAEGIDDEGRLILRTADGTRRPVSAGDVTLRKD